MSGVVDQLIEKLDNFLGRILYAIERIVCLFISWLQQLFSVFTGITPAKYKNNDEYLINVFFGNKVVNAIYWGMAAIGIVMVFIFTIMAVTRKGFDLDDKMRQSHGQILRSFMRSIFIIISLSLFMTITINFTNVLMDSVNDVFNNAPTLVDGETHIEYTNEQYAAMARVFNTVGNYSLNPSSNNRYNLNTCYNEIRSDLKYLADTGVFDYYYNDKEDGKEKNTWQSVLQELATAADYNKEQPVDKYEEGIANALNHCKQVLMNDYSFRALQEYDKTRQYNKDEVSLDRVLFLSGTMGIGNNAAAKNDAFNKNPDMLDNVRAPYYTGDKSIYDLDQVNEDFYVSFSRMNYLLIYLVGIAIVVNMAIIIVNCIVRIFNLLFLYIIAPPIIAVSPLDDGGKFKQWLTAFIIQAFSVFATVISMRIFLIFVPIVMNPSLQLVENSVVSTMGKLVMIWAGTVAIEKANGLLTGILADNAGWQSIMAGSTAQDVKGSTVGRLASAAQSSVERTAAAPVTAVAGKAMGIAKGTLGAVGRTAALPFRPLVGAVANTASRFSEGFSGFENKLSNSVVSSPDEMKRQADAKAQNKAAQDRNEQKQFRNTVSSYLAGQAQQGGSGTVPPRASGGAANSSSLKSGSQPAGSLGVGVGAGIGTGADSGAGAGSGGNAVDVGGAGAAGARGAANNAGKYDATTQKLFGVDANGNVVNTRGAGANAGSVGGAGAAGARGAANNAGKYDAATQKLFGVDANGNVVNTRGAGANAGSVGGAGAAGARGAANNAGKYDAATQKLFGVDENGNVVNTRAAGANAGSVGGAGAAGAGGAANNAGKYNAATQKLFGVDANGNVVNTRAAGANAGSVGGAGAAGAGGAANNAGKYNAATQKLFGVDANGNVVNTRGAGANAGSVGGAGAAGARGAANNAGKYDAATQKLFGVDANGNVVNTRGAGGNVTGNNAGSNSASHGRQLDPEIQKLFDEGGNNALPHNQGDLAQQNRELDAMLDALGIDSKQSVSEQKAPINIPSAYYDAPQLSENERAMLPYDDQGSLKDTAGVNRAVRTAQRSQRAEAPRSGQTSYTEMLNSNRKNSNNIKPPPKRNNKP